MFDLLRQADKRVKITLTEDFHKDLNWFGQFLTKFFSHDPVHCHIELDASLQGLRAVCDNDVYAIPIKLGFSNYQICPPVNIEHIGVFAFMGSQMVQEKNSYTL